MSRATVIGLGLMGSALARALQNAGHDLTVWNRSPAKMQPFIDDGVAGAPDLVSAIAASPVILICIDNYVVTNAMLQMEGVASLLADRTIVQLSTGTPKEADELSAWMAARHAAYLDGAILAGPNEIGTANAQILLSGNMAAYDRAGSLLHCLAGDLRYLGPNVRAASALDLAWLTTCYSRFVGIVHAANMCRSEGVGLDEFIALFPGQPDIQDDAHVIHTGQFRECTATLEVWGSALKRIQQQAVDSSISSEIPDFFAGFFKKAIDAGFGQENVMALFKIIRGVRT